MECFYCLGKPIHMELMWHVVLHGIQWRTEGSIHVYAESRAKPEKWALQAQFFYREFGGRIGTQRVQGRALVRGSGQKTILGYELSTFNDYGLSRSGGCSLWSVLYSWSSGAQGRGTIKIGRFLCIKTPHFYCARGPVSGVIYFYGRESFLNSISTRVNWTYKNVNAI